MRLLLFGLCLGLASTLASGAPAKATPKPKFRASESVKATPVPTSTVSKPAATAEASGSQQGLGMATDLDSSANLRVSDEAQQIAKRAMAEFSKGDLATAKKDFEKVLELAPDNPATLINLGLIAYRQNNFKDAESRLTKAVRAKPEAGLAWLILGVIAYEQNKLDAALADLAQAALLEPKDARTHHYLGVTVGKKGWYSGAEDEMRKAIELDPNYAEAHFNLAVFYLQRNPPAVELARRHYQKALDLGAAPDSQVEKSLGTPKE